MKKIRIPCTWDTEICLKKKEEEEEEDARKAMALSQFSCDPRNPSPLQQLESEI